MRINQPRKSKQKAKTMLTMLLSETPLPNLSDDSTTQDPIIIVEDVDSSGVAQHKETSAYQTEDNLSVS